MTKLGVNVDHCATVRQARKEKFPDLVVFAQEAAKAGANSVTAHLREDRRHIQDDDIRRLRKELSIPLNLEMAMTEDILRIAENICPDWVCLVPEKRMELTTEGGLDLIAQFDRLKGGIERLKAKGIKVSLFIEPDLALTDKAKELNADAVEFHTGPYARAYQLKMAKEQCSGETLAASSALKNETSKMISAAKKAESLGLLPNAGHGLDYNNAGFLVEAFPFNEFNIGFSIVARSLFVGVQKAVEDMKLLLDVKPCVES